MPFIGSSPDSVKTYFEQNKSTEAISKLLEPLPKPILQHDHTCKLVAMSVVMEWLYMQHSDVLPVPPPTRSRDRQVQGKSLRKEAKAHGSEIGEIYDHQVLLQLAQKHGYETSHIVNVANGKSNDYINNLKCEIDNNNAPIVFFDVDPRTGEPIYLHSQREHAAVIGGYFTNIQGKTCFILLQWNGYYCVHAEQLQASANQLADNRAPETFFKIDKLWRQEGDRNDNDASLSRAINARSYARKVVAGNPSAPGTSFKNTIFVLGSSRITEKQNQQKLLLSLKIKTQPDAVMTDLLVTNEVTDSQHNIIHKGKLFIPLDVLINFIEIDSIRPVPYSPEKLQEFADNFPCNDEITALTQVLYHTEVDQSLDDDIYKQNPNRTRSITEVVSNAIDAQPSRIDVTIADGSYEVMDYLGCGITPEHIFRKLLLTKATSKEDSDDKIGRFGLGFYTTLAHPNQADDYVIIKTKHRNYPGYCVEFRKIAGKLCVTIAKDDSIVQPGTSIRVKSADITAEEYQQALEKNIKFHAKTPIYINGILANNFPKNIITPSLPRPYL